MEQQYVIFDLGSESYGVDIAAVESIIKMQTITRLPQAPDFVEGITNLRGSVVPVIDLRYRFGLEKAASNRDTRIIVTFLDLVKVGMVVDAVSQVLRVPSDAIEPPPPFTTSIDSAFIMGIAKLEGRLVILLDLAKVLNLKEQATLQALPVAA